MPESLLSRRAMTTKLTLLMALSSGIALLVSCAAFVVNDVALLRASKAQNIRGLAGFLATHSARPLQQRQQAPLEDTLTALRERPDIVAACVFDGDGRPLAAYHREAPAELPPVPPPYLGHHFTDDGFLDVALPVVAQGGAVGRVYLRATVGDLHGQIHRFISVAAGVMIASLGVAILIGWQLQRFITEPILNLALTIRRIKEEGDYSIRVKRPSDDEIGALYDEFNAMLLRIDLADAALQRAHEELREANNQLEQRVRERTDELSQANQQLIETSRKAGMAEVANGVLHNVGNVLNSVNVAAALINEMVRNSEINDLNKVVAILEDHHHDLVDFLSQDPRGQHLPRYLIEASRVLTRERQSVLEKLESLNKNIDHIKAVVSTQQSYAGMSGVEQMVALDELMDDALQINSNSLDKHQIAVERGYADLPPISIDKQKVLQILINLIGNAKHAVRDAGRPDGLVRLRVVRDGDDWVRLEVIDNGTGIARENLDKIFRHGFTTKADGHGFGLHSAALAANEMGGALTAASDGPGHGATFSLRLPLKVREAFV